MEHVVFGPSFDPGTAARGHVPRPPRPARLRAGPRKCEQRIGAARALTLVELLREAPGAANAAADRRRIPTEEEIEGLGLTFLRLAEEMQHLKKQFGFTDDDLNLDLGPLGRLR